MRKTNLTACRLESLTVNRSADLVSYKVQNDDPAAMCDLIRYYSLVAW